MKKITLLLGSLLLCYATILNAQTTIDFDTLSISASGHINGSDKSLQDTVSMFECGNVNFENSFSRQDFGTGPINLWSGFAYSKNRNDSTAGYGNQYSAYFADTSMYASLGTYAIGYYDTWAQQKGSITFDTETTADYLYLGNTTYTYMALRYGNDGAGMVADSFQAANNDTFKVVIEGYDAGGNPTDTVDCYLAKFTDGDEYVIDSMMRVDIAVLGDVKALKFSIESSDGMMPTYFVLDSINGNSLENLTYTLGKNYWNGSENIHGDYSSSFSMGDIQLYNTYTLSDYGYGLTEAWKGFAFSNMSNDSTVGFDNQYSAYMADPADYTAAENYAVGFQGFSDTTTVIEFGEFIQPDEIKLANTTYAYFSMKYGEDGAGFVADSFQAANNDTFKVVVEAIDTATGEKVNKACYLAKFTDGDEYVVDSWETVDLTTLPVTDKLTFYVQSSDAMIPKYFCFDDLKYSIKNSIKETSPVNLTVYPNPFSHYINIDADKDITRLAIFDITGKIVFACDEVQLNEVLYLDELNKGIYIISIQGEDYTITRKIIKN